MKRVEVLIPFHRSLTDTDQIVGDVITVSDEELNRIKAVNINMVSVIGEVKKRTKKDQ